MCLKHFLIIIYVIISKWDNFYKSDKNLSTFKLTLAKFWKFFVREASSALLHFPYFSRISYFSFILKKVMKIESTLSFLIQWDMINGNWYDTFSQIADPSNR